MIYIQIAFWLIVFLVVYSYFIYPALISLIGHFFHENRNVFSYKDENLPSISIIMSVYNEEDFIQRKIESVLKTSYPIEKIEFLIGSDCSTDKTNAIVKELQQEYKLLKFSVFEERMGKIAVVNELYDKAIGEILILTDAKAIFNKETIFELVKHFRNDKVAIVGANIQSREKSQSGSGRQETFYMNYENRVKYLEGIIFKSVIGVFGACYAIRKTDFHPIPNNFLVDDFFISLKVLEEKKQVIYSKNASVIENVTPSISEEYRRKKRIATGNFQNLRYFWKILFKPFSKSGFCFISHKLIRWFGFLFLPILFILNIFIVETNVIYLLSICFQAAFYIAPLIDKCLRKIKIQIIPLRFITHFVLMNIAMFIGFLNYIKGVKSNVWEPTKRE